VVASEVKNLANQTAKATEEISGQIGEMQQVSGKAVDAIAGIGRTIERISEIATAIAAAVQEQGAATDEIARNVQQAAAGTTQVSGSMEQVTRTAGDTGGAAREMLYAAGLMQQEVQQLRNEVNRFLDQVRAA